MERLDGFVAGSLLQRLRHPAGDPTVATCASFRGAVLFVDISGYTVLAEAICSRRGWRRAARPPAQSRLSGLYAGGPRHGGEIA